MNINAGIRIPTGNVFILINEITLLGEPLAMHVGSLSSQQGFLVVSSPSLLKKWAATCWSPSTRRPGFLCRTCVSFEAIHSTRDSLASLCWPIMIKLPVRWPVSFFWPAWQVSPLLHVFTFPVICSYKAVQINCVFLSKFTGWFSLQRFWKEELSLGPTSRAMWKRSSGTILSTLTATPKWCSRCPSAIHVVSETFHSRCSHRSWEFKVCEGNISPCFFLVVWFLFYFF